MTSKCHHQNSGRVAQRRHTPSVHHTPFVDKHGPHWPQWPLVCVILYPSTYFHFIFSLYVCRLFSITGLAPPPPPRTQELTSSPLDRAPRRTQVPLMTSSLMVDGNVKTEQWEPGLSKQADKICWQGPLQRPCRPNFFQHTSSFLMPCLLLNF